MPLMQLFLFGYALNTDVKHIPTIINDQAQDSVSRRFIESLTTTVYFDVTEYVNSSREVNEAIDRGEAKVGILIPPDFSTRLRAGRETTVQILVDGSDPLVAQAALFAANSIVQAHATEIMAAVQGRTLGGEKAKLLIDLRPIVLYNPSMQSVNFMIPGLIGLILQMQAVMLTMFAIVRERERGTLEQLIVTPIRPWELMLGKVLPYVIIAFWNIGLALVIGVFWFKVPFAGNLALLLTLSLFFLLSSLGIGMLISTVSRTQSQAMQVGLFYMLPSFIISGLFFPLENMPRFLVYLSYVIPLRYFIRILRGIILKGIGMEYLWMEVIPLVIFGLVIFAISAARFQKRLE